ncbi:MAG TPA: cytochrome c biogenesis protein [Acidobacteriota bacterium]|nr:cytochrome c biogenesis protein [Acidobacteriota bacterium]
MWSATDKIRLRQAERYLTAAKVLAWPAFLLILAALYMAFIYAPRERQMGEVQRIFYFHIGAAWNALGVCFLAVFIAGILYLWKKRRIWDHVGASFVEIGLAYTTINLTTGMFWARPVWNTWWPWGDPRVTLMLVLWLIYVAYMIFRSTMPDGEKKYKYCAVFGIIGFLDVPLVYVSIHIWRTIHPKVITSEGMALETPMIMALFTSMAAFTALTALLFCLRMAMRLQRTVVLERLYEETV